MNHSPIPWKLGIDSDDEPVITDRDGNRIATVPMGHSSTSGSWSTYEGNDEQLDFEFIVRAVNSHEALLAATKHYHEFVLVKEYNHVDSPDCCATMMVIAQAEKPL